MNIAKYSLRIEKNPTRKTEAVQIASSFVSLQRLSFYTHDNNNNLAYTKQQIVFEAARYFKEFVIFFNEYDVTTRTTQPQYANNTLIHAHTGARENYTIKPNSSLCEYLVCSLYTQTHTIFFCFLLVQIHTNAQ